MFYGRFSGIREREPGGVLNILLRACRCARVWTVQKKSGKVKIPAGWDEKYSGRMEFFIGWHEKKSGNTPRGREKIFVRTENSFRKMRIFPLKSPGKSAKMMKTGRKISFPARGKTWKLSRWRGKTCPKLGNGNRKKRIFLLKKFRRSIKIRGRNGKISQFPHEKNLKNIRIVRKDMPENRWQKQNKTDSSFKKVPRKQKNYGKLFLLPKPKCAIIGASKVYAERRTQLWQRHRRSYYQKMNFTSSRPPMERCWK